MQGPIAQIAALTIYGNASLAGRDVSAFWPTASVFAFCKTVNFVHIAGDNQSRQEVEVAQNPIAWFKQLRKERVVGLRLHHVPVNDAHLSDRMSVGFAGGGGRWLIEVVRPSNSDIWEAAWEVGNKDDAERKIWKVTYGRTLTGGSHRPPAKAVTPSLRDELERTLTDTACFAEKHDLFDFAGYFRRGIEALHASTPDEGLSYRDFAPPGMLALETQQLLAAVRASWVFGGMGSWNDLGFDPPEQEQYERLSDKLFNLLNQSIIEGVNASFGGSAAARPWWKVWGSK